MHLFYIANFRFPTERAHGIQVAHMCSSFARRHGTDAERDQRGTHSERVAVTLLVPDRKTFSGDPFAYYGVERNFTVEKIPVPDIVRFGRVGFFIESLVFAYRATKRIHKAVDLRCPERLWTPAVYIYTREELPLLFLPRGSAWYEAHQLRRSFFFRCLIKRAKGIIAISRGLKTALVQTGAPEERILVAPDGYDEKQFAERIDKDKAREKLGLPRDKKIAMYIGGLESWKGAETLCRAAASLAHDGIVAVIIGGTEKEITGFRAAYPEVLFVGTRPYRELSQNQQAADILVVPNSAESEIGRTFTSPLKLFAHLTSGVALVVADVSSLREVVAPTQAFLFTPDDSRDLARVIQRALSTDFLSERLSKPREAEKRARDFTWSKRARQILEFVHQSHILVSFKR